MKKTRAGGSSAVNARRTVPLSYAATLGRSDLLIMLGLAVVTLAIYAQVIGHQFITLDDPTYIQENPMVNRGVTLRALAWAFTTFYAANWHPLTWISHTFNADFSFRHTAWSVPECTAFLFARTAENLAYLQQSSFAILACN